MDEFCHPIAGSNISAYCKPSPGRFMEYFPTCLIKPCQLEIKNYIITYNGCSTACVALYTTPSGGTSAVLVPSGDTVIVCAQIDSVKVTCPLEDFDIVEGGDNCIEPIPCYCYTVFSEAPYIKIAWVSCEGIHYEIEGKSLPFGRWDACAQEDSVEVSIATEYSIVGGTSICTSNEDCTFIPCYCYNVALGGTGTKTEQLDVHYINCNGDEITTRLTGCGKLPCEEINICAKEESIIITPITEGSYATVNGGTNVCTTDEDCIPITTTSTTSTSTTTSTSSTSNHYCTNM